MSLYKNITLYISKTECHNCKKEYNAAYMIVEYDDSFNVPQKKATLSPDSFSDKEKEIAKENGVLIETRGYGDPTNPEVFTVNICPHCNKPFGNNYIKKLVGKEIKAIIIRQS